MNNSINVKQSGVKGGLIASWRFFNKNVLTLVLSAILSAILSLVIVARVTNWWTGPQAYRVYVAGSFNPSEDTTQEVWQGFTQKGKLIATLDGVKVIADQVNDAGDPSEASKVAGRLAGSNDTLMVVGHQLSTQSQAALPYYLQIQEPVPVILATETNPKLLPPINSDESPYPVFRLSPTDDEQAAKAVDFAVETLQAHRFWIVQDTNNPTYSEYLAKQFQTEVRKDGRDVVKSTMADVFPDPDELRKAAIDCVFFAGDEFHAMTLIDQIGSVAWVKKPRIMLSDWSVGPNLIPSKGQAAEGVFLIHPLAADVYTNDQYAWYGAQAREIVEDLMRRANSRFSEAVSEKKPFSYFFRRLLNIHRVEDARTAISAIMKERHTFPTTRNVIYSFDHDGKSFTSEFHVWQIQKQKFVECQEESNNCK